ncbi:PIN domain-containing protein [Planktothrix agardhii]|jgi:hypothetical protein|nr:PIN domain-containing protein [Planktothrix agardhii]CAD5910890.1 PIN domain-containing protein [Planktothrix agardhii]CAD5911111.1 PIN domain-containing protein [Planktothrix agardhii]CAD5957704.1 PIN domain-containing protein [Planktothrix agardhii]CAD5973440.1 PIN domain-containing protein [Planktothrix agardhii]
MVSLWILDTDHISLFQREHPQVVARLSRINPNHRAVTIFINRRLDSLSLNFPQFDLTALE